jgi:hypothetical protein
MIRRVKSNKGKITSSTPPAFAGNTFPLFPAIGMLHEEMEREDRGRDG